MFKPMLDSELAKYQFVKAVETLATYCSPEELKRFRLEVQDSDLSLRDVIKNCISDIENHAIARCSTKPEPYRTKGFTFNMARRYAELIIVGGLDSAKKYANGLSRAIKIEDEEWENIRLCTIDGKIDEKLLKQLYPK